MADNCYNCGQRRRPNNLDEALDHVADTTAERDSYLRARNGLFTALAASVLATGAAAPAATFSTAWMTFLLVVGILGIIISSVCLVITFMSSDGGLAPLNSAVRAAERDYRTLLTRETS